MATAKAVPGALAARLGLPMKELVVAPMVDASELPFRMLCRKYGAKLCWTPMLHARLFRDNPQYRKRKFSTCEEDRPLVVQFCGHDKDVLLAAAKLVETQCDAVDLNLGCPQGIARKGRYGAFLLEEVDLLASIVEHLASNLAVPVTCKIRLLDIDSVDRTIALAKRLEASGCSLLTVHGRTKEQNKALVGSCNWEAIRKIREALSIPVIANGGVGTQAEARECQAATGVAAVMSSEAILEMPALVANSDSPLPTVFQVARDYVECVETYPDIHPIVRAHMFKFLHGPFTIHTEMRDYFTQPGSMRKPLPEYLAFLREGVDKLERMHQGEGACTNEACRSQNGAYGAWYDRYQKRNPALYETCEATGEKVYKGAKTSVQDMQAARLARRALKKQRKAELVASTLKAREAKRRQHEVGLERKRKREEGSEGGSSVAASS